MITLSEAIISQFEIIIIGISLLWIRSVISGNSRELRDMIPSDFQNKYYAISMSVFWFIIFPVIIYYFQLPRYGMWSYLFAYDCKIGWLVFLTIIITRIGMMLVERFSPRN